MPNLVKIAAKSELPSPGEAREFTCSDKMICVANIDGTLTAMDNVCLHRGGPLGQGVVDGGKVICPWHGWEYDAKTGEASHNPAAKVAVYPIKVEGENVMVEI
ncbi:MAG TPA: Rieske (2Fe-2S) protein [Terriglobales bacterium]|nr:Rieske (2Fe-2S) protein [Terriglobales bacterium]